MARPKTADSRVWAQECDYGLAVHIAWWDQLDKRFDTDADEVFCADASIRQYWELCDAEVQRSVWRSKGRGKDGCQRTGRQAVALLGLAVNAESSSLVGS